MKRTFQIAVTYFLFCHQTSVGAEDPRFTNGNLGVENSYLVELYDAVLKAFDRDGAKLRGLKGVHKVGETYFVTGFITLDAVKEPITEKDFARLNDFFQVFIKKQIVHYREKGLKLSHTSNSFPLPAYAKGYTNDQLPIMSYSISGEDSDVFSLNLTFTERKDDHLVISFNIASIP